MIDAANITDYNLSDEELEGRIVFWILAAGKNGTRAAEITNTMLDNWKRITDGTPFKILRIHSLEQTIAMCENYGTGCQSIKGRSLYEISRSGLNLRTCSAEDLEKIYGIGMKTARCFIIHSRKDAEYAALDTHMLKHLASLGYDVPKSTPSSKKTYIKLEQEVLKLAALSNLSAAAFDLSIWNTYKVVYA